MMEQEHNFNHKGMYIAFMRVQVLIESKFN